MVRWLVLLMIGWSTSAAAAERVKLDGYAEWRFDDILIVEGQRVRVSESTSFRGSKGARSFWSIPLGYEVKVDGVRTRDGSVLARRVEAKPNGTAMFEARLHEASDTSENQWRRRGYVYEGSGGRTQSIGRLLESGPEVARVRRITEKLVPPTHQPGEYRVYVIENDAWNAMAAPNGSVYV